MPMMMVVVVDLPRSVSEITITVQSRKFSYPRLFNALTDGIFLLISQRRRGLKTRMMP